MLLTILAAAAALAAGASAAVPPGNGLVLFPALATCSDGSSAPFTTQVLVVRGGPPGSGPAWFLQTGNFGLAQSATLTSNGEVIFSKTYGAAGPHPLITCTGDLGDGVTFTIVTRVIR